MATNNTAQNVEVLDETAKVRELLKLTPAMVNKSSYVFSEKTFNAMADAYQKTAIFLLARKLFIKNQADAELSELIEDLIENNHFSYDKTCVEFHQLAVATYGNLEEYSRTFQVNVRKARDLFLKEKYIKMYKSVSEFMQTTTEVNVKSVFNENSGVRIYKQLVEIFEMQEKTKKLKGEISKTGDKISKMDDEIDYLKKLQQPSPNKVSFGDKIRAFFRKPKKEQL